MNSSFTLAIHSLTYLALHSKRISSSEEIAESACVHPVRIRKILSLLKKHGFIQSKEGTGGGFKLAMPMKDVTLWDIYKITSEGSLQPKCPEVNDKCIVGANIHLALFSVFLGAEKHLGEYLNDYTIEEMLDFVKVG